VKMIWNFEDVDNNVLVGARPDFLAMLSVLINLNQIFTRVFCIPQSYCNIMENKALNYGSLSSRLGNYLIESGI
jgi:hypothetical protein